MRPIRFVLASAAILAVVAGGAVAQPLCMHPSPPDRGGGHQLSRLEELGKKLFFDTNLSVPPGQSCASCHGPKVGFTGPVSSINAGGGVYPGAADHRFGNRKPPAAAYAGASPILDYDATEDVWIGGMFWDGRATGWTLDDPLAEQAQGPFLNPLEQNIPRAKQVVMRVSHSDYARMFIEVWGPGSLDPIHDVRGSYERIARSIAAYERSAEVNPFSSKYDDYLKGKTELTTQEMRGLELFEGRAMCAGCHPNRPGPNGEPPVFTDYTYDNLGVPRNPANPFYTMSPKFNPAGPEWIDAGLGGFLAGTGYADQASANWGKQKVPTLRNVDLRPNPAFVKAFTHNAYFKSLEDIVHFYNTRDVEAWPAPEVAENVNRDELGHLGLTADEEAAVVSFLKTLSDGYINVMQPDVGMPQAALITSGSELGITGSNPFQTSTHLNYAVTTPGQVVIGVYDLLGRNMETLVNEWQQKGRHALEWSPKNLSSGVYFVRVQANGEMSQYRVTLLK
jgi:cytochrome c peroxidase